MRNYRELYLILSKTLSNWLRYHEEEGLNSEVGVVDKAFIEATRNSTTIIESINTRSEISVDYLKPWIEIGLFAGFLSGHLEGNKKDFNPLNKKNLAKMFSEDVSSRFFNFLNSPPAVLLFEMTPREIELLEISLEKSLYTGFLNGIN
jgi:hypothetical protein